MGFSAWGLAIGLAVLAPNLLLPLFPPRTSIPSSPVPRALGWLERAGQALCLVVPALTASGDPVWWWLIPMLAALAGYYALWARYLLGGRRGEDLYRPLGVLPVPMAILPVLVFLASAGWLGSAWIAAAAVVLAAGHVPAAAMRAARG
ncbi:hypothetical protein [Microbacterium marinilacus]|uniref:Uncharacterized protein n=1 Tax=Microbacterium marinilacus TaxID=415209 RepID=A0ABP7BQH3_9MICO|nr:hypothetical protein [Microbacterium marinilacus]MBY0687708.1 hypothetical protein [Microbacterium marinilacus]